MDAALFDQQENAHDFIYCENGVSSCEISTFTLVITSINTQWVKPAISESLTVDFELETYF